MCSVFANTEPAEQWERGARGRPAGTMHSKPAEGIPQLFPPWFISHAVYKHDFERRSGIQSRVSNGMKVSLASSLLADLQTCLP